ncbi:MAG: hypothetical protein ACP5GZ_04395 [Vulcanisaeta sp.]|jgi:hypothetical protein|uniref:hypothetical protein n=1 Tax=Vulcanisaeta sp. TaxID=2020871 RepID=UPI003D143671
MFGRKRKVDLEELLQELTGDEDGDGRSRVRKRVSESNEDYEQSGGIRFKVEFEGIDELIREIRSLKESINELTTLLREQGEPTTTKK